MAGNGIVQARIDNAIKAEAALVLSNIGLTVSDAVRLLLTRIAHDKAMPFNPLVPNAETITAMEEARKGNLPRAHSVKELFEALNEDD